MPVLGPPPVKRDAEDALEVATLYGTQLPWTDAWTPEGVIEVLEPLTLASRQRRICGVVEQRLASVTVVMDAPYDPHNGGAVLRSCDAFGVQQIHVVARDESFLVSPGVAKGTERWVDVIVHAGVSAAASALSDSGHTLVATHPEGKLRPHDLAEIPRLAIVLGNERDGISEELRAHCAHSVQIPMRGFVESLNVSVTGALLLHAATAGRAGDLQISERRRLYARGLFRSVHRAGEVLANLTPR